MAKLKIEFEENGSLKLTLDFLGHTYTQEITRLEDGAMFYGEDLRSQVKAKHDELLLNALGSEEKEELLIEISEIADNNLIDCIGDNIAALTEYEQRIKAEAKP